MYKVYDMFKNLVMESEDNSRYDKPTEKELKQAGYTIYLDGRKL